MYLEEDVEADDRVLPPTPTWTCRSLFVSVSAPAPATDDALVGHRGMS